LTRQLGRHRETLAHPTATFPGKTPPVTNAADDLRGKRVLVGLTCVGPDNDVLLRLQTDGVVAEVREDVILLTREDGTTFGLPPDRQLLVGADRGVYTLRETGESIEDPDFLVSLTITINDLASLGDIKAHGFMP
jgi:hypothetical protein